MTCVGKQTQRVAGLGRRVLLAVRRGRDLRRAKRARRDTDAPTHEYVVVLTYGRTGSTVLQAVLNSVDGVCIRGENHAAAIHLWNLYESVRRTLDEHGGGTASDSGNPWFGAHLVDPEGLIEDLRKAFVEHVLRPPEGTRVLGFKEIRHTPEYFDTPEDLLEYVLFLDRLLPGVKFVVNTRDAEDTSRSAWWRTHPRAGEVLTQARAWLLDLPERIEDRLGPGRVVRLEYESWNGRPEMLLDVLERLGLRGDPARVRAISAHRLTHAGNLRPADGDRLPPDGRSAT